MATAKEQQQLVDELCHQWPKMLMVPITKRQAASSRDTPVRGPIWVSRGEFEAPPENSLRDALVQVAHELAAPEHILPNIDSVRTSNVRVEFVGQRQGVVEREPEPNIPEVEKLHRLQQECQRDATIIYAHGGGLYFSSPAEYRSVTTRLARLTGARVASVGYRLAPQSSFPDPLLDLLVAYASLLYPPPGAAYHAVPASKIVFTGNSSGANLLLCLTRFLLAWNARSDATVRFHGKQVALPLPAGVATLSAWCDPTDIFPSWVDPGQHHDILSDLQPALWPEYPTDHVWPAAPPREHPYTRGVNLDHELITPAAVYDWRGAPPMWFAMGGRERSLDGSASVVGRLACSNVPVAWLQYEGMPHEWMILLRKLPQASHCFSAWIQAILDILAGNFHEQALLLKMPKCESETMGSLTEFKPLEFHEARRRMKAKNASRPLWTGQSSDNAKARI